MKYSAVFLALFLVLGERGYADDADDIYKQTLRSTTLVFVNHGTSMGQGTGWLVDRQRKLMITNYHVVGKSDSVHVMYPLYQSGALIIGRDFYLKYGQTHRSTVFDRNRDQDLAIIQLDSVPEGVEELKLAARAPKPEDSIYIVANPGRRDSVWVRTSGKVEEVYREKTTFQIQDRKLDVRAEQVSVERALGPGASGAPVVNHKAELVGVIMASNKEADKLVCIDASEVKELAAEACYQYGVHRLNHGYVTHAIADFSKAIEHNPNHARSYWGRHLAYQKKGETAKALKDYKLAVKLDAKVARAEEN